MAKAGKKNGIDLKLDMPSDAELKRIFDMAPKLDHYKFHDQVLRAGAVPIRKRARALAPRGDQKDRDRKHRKNYGSRGGQIDWQTPLWKTIKYVIRKYGDRRGRGVAIVGPEWPKGNKAYFNTSPSGRRRVLWGKQPVTLSKVAPQIRNWIVQAFDETKPQQLSAMKTKITAIVDKTMRDR